MDDDSAVIGGCVVALFDRLEAIQAARERRIDAFLAELHELDVEDERLRRLICEGLERWRREREGEAQYEDDLAAIREWEDGASPF